MAETFRHQQSSAIAARSTRRPGSHKVSFKSQVNDQGAKSYRELDNVGTRYETAERVKSYSFGRDTQGLKWPYIYHYWLAAGDAPAAKSKATAAMLELPFIKIASDSGKLISTEIIDFGLWPTTRGDGSIGAWNVLIGGNSLTAEMYDAAILSFKKFNGHEDRVSDQPQKKAASEQVALAASSSVEFVEELHPDPRVTKRYYKASSKSAAITFLQAHPVTQKMYYIEVDTPEGRFGRDIDGFYGD